VKVQVEVLFSDVVRYQRFEGPCCLYLQGGDGGNTALRHSPENPDLNRSLNRPVQVNQKSDWLQAGRSGVRNLAGAGIFLFATSVSGPTLEPTQPHIRYTPQ